MSQLWRIVGIVTAACLIGPLVPAADEPARGWSDTAELSYVLTDGNAESSSLGFKNLFEKKFDLSALTLKAGGIRVESTTTSRFAVGDPGDFVVTETSESATTAENYYLNGRYDRKITDRFFWYAGAGWDRNEFSGIQNRYTAVGGVGNIWRDDDTVKFKTDYALTYTDQADVVTVPGTDDTFLGARFSWDYLHRFTESTVYTNTLALDANVDDSTDWRADMVNAIAVSMSKRLALKASLQWLYDNQPSFASVPLFDTPGGTLLGAVPFELDELDTVFTTSLVINF